MEKRASRMQLLDAARRLGPRPVLLAAWHRGPAGRALALRALRDRPSPARSGRFLPGEPPSPAPGRLAESLHAAEVLGRASTLSPPDWHGSYDSAAPALALDPFAAGDIRPVWERNRWAELPLLVQAARLDPGGGHVARAEALLADWCGANPAFRGPNWVCGQEAALRVLHLGLALALLGGAGSATPPRAQELLALHARRIAATPAYAAAQDNNHAVSEAAGLLVCGLLLGDGRWAAQGAARLSARVRRLVAPSGAFGQLSVGYHRLLLDVLSVTEWMGRRRGGPGLDGEARARAAAAVAWLHRVVDPATGAAPRLGHEDGSAFADLSLAGPADARPERAARLLAGRSAGFDDDPGCAWLDLPRCPLLPVPPSEWESEGLWGWTGEGGARALLRTGPLRFRPGHADLLHLDLWDGALNLLRDGGTGAYNPSPDRAWWHQHLTGTAAHNTVEFDGADQMPRVGRFLFARWPETGRLPDGAWMRDGRGNRHARSVRREGARAWLVKDHVSGGFGGLALRWRLAPGAWRETAEGVEGPMARLGVAADAPLLRTLEWGWESPAYGEVRPVSVLVARAAAPVSRLLTRIELPPRGA
jgi:hypothetical protein